MLDFWFEIPAVFRATLALLVLGYGIASCFSGYRDFEAEKADSERSDHGPDMARNERARGEFELGFLATGIGTALVAISGRSSAEKKGYRSC